jgi:outer membrane protein insertion porin family
MKKTSFNPTRLFQKLFIVTLLLGQGGVALAAPIVTEVDVEGNKRVETGTVLLQVTSKVGNEVNSDIIDADVKQIFRTGFFSDVSSSITRTANGVAVTFKVKERPAIREVKLKGNESVTDDTLKDKLNVGARRFLDLVKIKAGIEQARQYYQGLGYFGVDIDLEQTPAETGEVDLTFVIKEGEKRKITEIVFDGSTVADTDELREAIKTKEKFWLTSWITGSGVLRKEQLEQDSKDLTRWYLNQGYVDARVGLPEVEQIDDGLRVTFKISEGEIYHFAKISAAGTLFENSEAKTLEGIEAKKGDTFSAEKLRKDTFTITEKFTDKGFAFTNVSPDTAIDREHRTVSVLFQVDKGKPIIVNRINITGNRKTADNVVRRSMQIQEQELFSSSKIKRSQELLQRLGHFEEANISTEPSTDPDRVDLNVAVREGNTGTFSIGAGLSSGDGVLFSSQVSENNLFGTGNSLTLDVNTGTRRQNFVLSFNNPRVDDSYFSFGADALSVMRNFDFFERKQTGGSFTLGYPLWFLGEELLDDIRASLTYELTQVSINSVDPTAPQLVKDQAGDTSASSVTPRLIRNTINNPLDPTKGSRQQASVEVAGLGGDQKFTLWQAQNTAYIHLFDLGTSGPLIFAPRQRIGWGQANGDDAFPLYRRFFPGGINSNRGYDARRMGPKDDRGQVYGGASEVLLNFDLIFPLVESVGLRGLVFFDAGNAYDDNKSFGNLRKAVGWGFRWRSPIAPIRIEFGYPLDKETGDSTFVTNFSFGNPL